MNDGSNFYPPGGMKQSFDSQRSGSNFYPPGGMNQGFGGRGSGNVHQQRQQYSSYSQNGRPSLSQEHQMYQASQFPNNDDIYNHPPRLQKMSTGSQSPKVYNSSPVIPPQQIRKEYPPSQNQQINRGEFPPSSRVNNGEYPPPQNQKINRGEFPPPSQVNNGEYPPPQNQKINRGEFPPSSRVNNGEYPSSQNQKINRGEFPPPSQVNNGEYPQSQNQKINRGEYPPPSQINNGEPPNSQSQNIYNSPSIPPLQIRKEFPQSQVNNGEFQNQIINRGEFPPPNNRESPNSQSQKIYNASPVVPPLQIRKEFPPPQVNNGEFPPSQNQRIYNASPVILPQQIRKEFSQPQVDNGEFPPSQNQNIYNASPVISPQQIRKEFPPPQVGNHGEYLPPPLNRIPPSSPQQIILAPQPIPGQVDHSIPPIDRKFSQLTSLEQVWDMPLLYESKPTWKFWFLKAFIILVILWCSVVGISIRGNLIIRGSSGKISGGSISVSG